MPDTLAAVQRRFISRELAKEQFRLAVKAAAKEHSLREIAKACGLSPSAIGHIVVDRVYGKREPLDRATEGR